MTRDARGAASLPGFGITLGLTLTWLSLIVLIPLAGCCSRPRSCSLDQFWAIVTSRRALQRCSSRSASRSRPRCVNLVFGTLVAWALVRYRFPGRRLLDAIVDLPFALPTAVAGIALTALYAENGWLGGRWPPLGIKVAFTPLGIFVALVFIGLPFVVRTVQPVLDDLEPELEEAAASLGASRWNTFAAWSCRASCRRC